MDPGDLLQLYLQHGGATALRVRERLGLQDQAHQGMGIVAAGARTDTSRKAPSFFQGFKQQSLLSV